MEYCMICERIDGLKMAGIRILSRNLKTDTL